MPKDKKQKLKAIDDRIAVIKQTSNPQNIIYDESGDYAFVLDEVKFTSELNALIVETRARIIFDDEIDPGKKQNIQTYFEQHYRRLVQAHTNFGGSLF